MMHRESQTLDVCDKSNDMQQVNHTIDIVLLISNLNDVATLFGI